MIPCYLGDRLNRKSELYLVVAVTTTQTVPGRAVQDRTPTKKRSRMGRTLMRHCALEVSPNALARPLASSPNTDAAIGTDLVTQFGHKNEEVDRTFLKRGHAIGRQLRAADLTRDRTLCREVDWARPGSEQNKRTQPSVRSVYAHHSSRTCWVLNHARRENPERGKRLRKNASSSFQRHVLDAAVPTTTWATSPRVA